MVYPDWREPANALAGALGKPTAAQLDLARLIGMRLTGDEPRAVVAAKLEDHLTPAIHGVEPRRPSQRQLKFLASLRADAPVPALTDLTLSSVSAWIDHFLGLRTLAALRDLELSQGDIVERRRRFRHAVTEEEMLSSDVLEVSSIRGDGLVFFKGGNGRCGWPSALSIIRRSPNAP